MMQASHSPDTSTSEPVVESVFHGEPAARIVEEIAQDLADIRWAEYVQQNIEAQQNIETSSRPQGRPEAFTGIQDGSGTHVHQEDDKQLRGRDDREKEEEEEDVHEQDDKEHGEVQEKVHLLRFGCNDTQAFRKLLLEGSHMKKCRDGLDKVGVSVQLPGGALMFVRPEHGQDVRRALDGMELCPFHVIISTRFESDLEDALASLPYRKRPREKAKDRREVALREMEGQEVQEPEDMIDCELTCKRTFLCFVPTLKEPGAVAQSTTEAVSTSPGSYYNYDRGVNPRRCV